MKATVEESAVLRHMLGIDKPEERAPVPYRDYYCADAGNPQLAAMEVRGLVECYSRHGGYDWYRCTASGRAAAFASHRGIRYRKPKRVYLRYLQVSDALPDLTFREFLTCQEFAEDLRNA